MLACRGPGLGEEWLLPAGFPADLSLMHSELPVKVVPGASRDAVAGWLGEALKIRVSAPPEKGKANTAVCALLAETLGLSAGAVTVQRGQGSPRKVLRIEGLDEDELRARLRTLNT